MTNYIFHNNIPFFIVFFILTSHLSSSIDVNITIFRNSTLQQPPTNSRDRFNISSRDCNNNVDLCTNFGGSKLQDNCQCTCSEDKSTFGFYDGQWKCTENSIVRQHSGCIYYLNQISIGDTTNTPLYTLPVIGSNKDNNYVGGIPSGKTCKFIRNKATFLKCDGTWGQLNNQTLTKNILSLDLQGQSLYVGPYIIPPQHNDVLTGRLIRIPIECSGITWSPSQCVALKLKGNLKCLLVNKTLAALPKLSTLPSTRYPSTTVNIATTVALIITKPKKSSTSDNLTAVIAGSVAGGAAFVILILIIIVVAVCIVRRKAKIAKNSQSQRGQDNRAYETSMTMSKPNVTRQLPEPPGWPYSSIQRGPSSIIRTPNGTMAPQMAPSTTNSLSQNEEPLYGSIDDSPYNESTYSRLDHSKQTFPLDMPNRSSHLLPPNPHFMNGAPPSKTSTLQSNGSGFSGFMPYDLVGGKIDATLPRRQSTFMETPEDGRISPASRGYDVPEGVIRDNSFPKMPRNAVGFAGPNGLRSLDRRSLERDRGDSYEAVWEDKADDDFVTKIDLT